MISTRNKLHQVGTIIALAGGVMQIIVAIAIFFLPIIALCGSDGCRYTSLLTYLRQDMGGPSGLVMVCTELALIALSGTAVIAGSRNQNHRLLRLRCWLGGLIGLLVVYMSWMFGLYFLPGGLLLLCAALLLTFSHPKQ